MPFTTPVNSKICPQNFDAPQRSARDAKGRKGKRLICPFMVQCTRLTILSTISIAMTFLTNCRRFLGRRRFLGTVGATLTAPPLLTNHVLAQESAGAEPRLADSLPSLQCPKGDSMTVVWSVGQSAAGFVQYGTDKDNLDQTAYGDVFGLNAYHPRFLQVRLGGLQPNTRYYYRTVTRSFQFVNAYTFRQGEPEYSETYSFETPGWNKAAGTFSVINDTHNSPPLLRVLGERLHKINSDYTLWNGDLAGSFDNERVAIDTILKPGGGAFSTEKPILFVPGNHDYRGEWARNLSLCLAPWEQSQTPERQIAQWGRPLNPNEYLNPSTGRNFVVRMGPLALIGLDTGEDKPDNREEWGGLALFEPYRIKQRDWLEKALQSEQVASAPFVVAFCHIPIFDSRPNANGGDLPTGFASFQRQAGDLWGPVLTKYGVQAVIAAHTHRHRFDAPTEDRTWAQIVGGGPNLDRDVTVIHGKAEGDTLEIVVDSVGTDTELGRWTFAKR